NIDGRNGRGMQGAGEKSSKTALKTAGWQS
ncbi:MAG: hypothetical protein JWQ09_5787, partial [Segetibacter sp.]|nr:hypothetical protein [Segetibacter sp.]